MKLENLGVVSQSYKYIPSRLILIILIVGLASNNFLGIEPPVNVNLLKNGDNVIISWDEVNGSEKYYIYKGYSSYEELTKTDSTTILSYQETETQSKCFYNITSSDKFTVNMTFVEGSEYLMGDHYHDGYYDEWPLHMVEVNNFYIQDTEVTQKEWVEIMGVDNIVSSNWGCWGVGDNFPAYGLSWYDAIVYCNKRSIRDGLFPCYSINGSSNPDDWGEIPTVSNPDWNNVQCNWNSNGYRLLTEAEWEYAARGGMNWINNFKFSGCFDDWNLRDYALFESATFCEVKVKLPNQLNLYGMSGNVIEFCWDGAGMYSSAHSKNPTGPKAVYRIRRGGSRYSEAKGIRIANRASYNPSSRYPGAIGFRIGASDNTQEFQAVTINSPDSIDVLTKTSSVEIKWNSNFSNDVTIELYKAGTFYALISSTVYNDGSYLWTIPSVIESAPNYKIKISSNENSNIYDFSDFEFTISEEMQNFCDISFPCNNSIIMKNRKYQILWSNTIDNNVRIDLLKENDFELNITQITENDGIFEWFVPDSLPTDSLYKIKISSFKKDSIYSVTNYFSISDNNLVNMIFVQGGTFLMGDVLSEGEYKESPVHSVTLSDFWIGQCEVTQKDWSDIMGDNPSVAECGLYEDYPVNNVSWYSAIVYCNKKSTTEGLAPCYTINGSSNPDDWGPVPTSSNSIWNSVLCNWEASGYRLPTEAEWEYAARGGLFHNENLRFSGFNDPEKAEKYCWVNENSPSVKEVASLLPNQLDIYDMSGNVWEWCWDWYEYYSSDSQIDPTGPLGNSWKVQRGGGFRNFETSIRVSARDFLSQCFYINYTGLRLARSIENNRISEYGNFNFQLYQNYPNPFNPVTSISYALPQASQVELNVYNLQGQLVQSLVNGKMGKGVHKAEFNGADLTSGMYIYNLKVDGETVQSKKMMLLK